VVTANIQNNNLQEVEDINEIWNKIKKKELMKQQEK
jgi:hypothetical protein